MQGEGREMKRTTIATMWTALLFAAVLSVAGCGQAPASSASAAADSASASASSTSNTPAASATMADYLHEHYSDFDAFNEGIQSGKTIPESLRLLAPGEADGYVYDKDVIVATWNELCATKIDLNNPTKKESEAGGFTFDFDSGREVIPFPFLTSNYADFNTGELYPVQNPDEVQALYDKIAELAKENVPKPGVELVEHNGAYLWDANGDGILEHMWLDFNGNGDEAPSGYSIRLFNGNLDVSEYLDNTNRIEKVELQEDADGAYVVLTTDRGEHTVRLVGNELQVK